MERTTVNPGPGVIYTETTVYSAPEQFVSEAPYQVVIVSLDAGGRLTGRVAGDAVKIDDRVEFMELRNGVPFFSKKA
jgi:uncharacterized OB-fold protein